MFASPAADARQTARDAGSAPPVDDWTNPLADWTELQFSPVKIDAVARVLAEAGVSPAVLLEGTGVDPARLQDADCKTSSAQLYRTLVRAAALSPFADLGRRIGARLRISGYGMYGYALLSAPTMRAAMDRALRFHALANPLVPIRITSSEGMVSWQCPARHALLLPDLDERLYRLLIELQLATHHQLAQDVMGAWCQPTEVTLAWPAPDDAATWAAAFGVAPRFGAEHCELRYPAAWLDRAPHLANAVTAAQTSRECARLLESLEGGASVARRVYRELMRTPGPFPGIEAVAESLHMTGRTLRRHLSAEGTSYLDLLARVRRALAEDYLRATRMTIDDIAAALSFSDARSFRHAFARWTGCSPSDWRRSGGAAHAPARRP
ncbi:MAG TPA: AraC family transcriptional regulator [Aquabacterium sp.]|nr:AraC family transcriptional regulator [Aquabacterium sp.]HQC98987.1 AraC family transcriptional regulator [Aquabacterium sp.]